MKERYRAIIFFILSVMMLSGCSSLGSTFKDYSNYSFLSCQKNDNTDESCKCHSRHESICYEIESKVYAGTMGDIFILAAPFVFAFEKTEQKEQVAWVMPFFLIAWPFALVDLPFSSLSDSILYKVHKNQDDELILSQHRKTHKEISNLE